MSVDFGHSQPGDVSIPGGVAGGNIISGIPPEHVLPQLLAEIHDQRLDTEADRRNREVRQIYLDGRLDQILVDLRDTRDAMAAEAGASRVVLNRMTMVLTIQSVSLGALLVLAVGVIVALISRRATRSYA
jgi:hypothetical protein